MIAHGSNFMLTAVGIDKYGPNARKMWYRIARDVMLSEAHAEHIIGALEAPDNPHREVPQ